MSEVAGSHRYCHNFLVSHLFYLPIYLFITVFSYVFVYICIYFSIYPFINMLCLLFFAMIGDIRAVLVGKKTHAFLSGVGRSCPPECAFSIVVSKLNAHVTPNTKDPMKLLHSLPIFLSETRSQNSSITAVPIFYFVYFLILESSLSLVILVILVILELYNAHNFFFSSHQSISS